MARANYEDTEVTGPQEYQGFFSTAVKFDRAKYCMLVMKQNEASVLVKRDYTQ